MTDNIIAGILGKKGRKFGGVWICLEEQDNAVRIVMFHEDFPHIKRRSQDLTVYAFEGKSWEEIVRDTCTTLWVVLGTAIEAEVMGPNPFWPKGKKDE